MFSHREAGPETAFLHRLTENDDLSGTEFLVEAVAVWLHLLCTSLAVVLTTQVGGAWKSGSRRSYCGPTTPLSGEAIKQTLGRGHTRSDIRITDPPESSVR